MALTLCMIYKMVSEKLTLPNFSRAEKPLVGSAASTIPSTVLYVAPWVITVKSDVVGSAPAKQSETSL